MPSVHDGHRQRTKQQALATGLDHMPPHKILELMLFYTIPQRDTNELAHLLLNTFGSLSGVFDASYEALMQVKGIKENTATFIKLLPQFWKAYELDLLDEKKTIHSYKELGQYFVHLFIGLKTEAVFAVAFDYKMKIKNTIKLSGGDFSGTSISVKLLVDFALKNNSDLIAIAHNHPGGRIDPSMNDIITTQKLVRALKPLGIRLVDHIIVADTFFSSMENAGMECLQGK